VNAVLVEVLCRIAACSLPFTQLYSPLIDTLVVCIHPVPTTSSTFCCVTNCDSVLVGIFLRMVWLLSCDLDTLRTGNLFLILSFRLGSIAAFDHTVNTCGFYVP
jgi:hypothetical protein